MAKKSKFSVSDALELKAQTNGMSDDDAIPESEPMSDPMQFTCSCRCADLDRDGYNYLVEPIGGYDDLDFEGQIVIINGRERMCSDFKVTEDGIVIFVSSLSDTSK